MARAMGATAISRVIRSGSMPRQHLVEVEAPVQPHRGPGRRRGQQVEQPEDVRRRRGHLEPVVGTRAQGGAPVRGGVADRVVRVAHRLGQAGGARAEDQHRLGRRRLRPHRRPVGRRAPATPLAVAGSSSSVTRPAPSRSASNGAAAASATPWTGPVSSSACADLDPLPRRADQDGGGTQLADGVDGDHELDPVGHHHRHPVARPDLGFCQVTGAARS